MGSHLYSTYPTTASASPSSRSHSPALTPSLTSSARYSRPVFASDLAAQRSSGSIKKSSTVTIPESSLPSPSLSTPTSAATTATTSSSTLSPSLQKQTSQQQQQPQRSHSGFASNMPDISAKLGELPGIHLPDFHLPDLQRLKQQLNKHTPSFSLKSLQHTFHVPSYSSYTTSFSTPSSSSSSTSSTMSSTAAAADTKSASSRLSFTSRLSRSSSVGLEKLASKRNSIVQTPTKSSTSPKSAGSNVLSSSNNNSSTINGSGNGSSLSLSSLTAAQQSDPHASSPISIPTHPSNYLIKKQATTTAPTPVAKTEASVFSDAVATTSQGLLSSDAAKTGGTTSINKASTSTQSPVGHLFLQVIEARNLTLVNPPTLSRPYCLVEYDQNELITPPALQDDESSPLSPAMMMGRRAGNDIFAKAMAASSPKWRHDAEFDVVRPNQHISITIFDSETEEDDSCDPGRRFLGQVKLSPSEVHNRMIDSWFRLQGREANEQVTGEIRVTIRYQAVESRHLSTSDFDILRVLGVGSFGKVYQVRKKDTGRIYAMKVLVKKQVIEQKQVEHTIAERNVLIQALQSPFIVGLKFSFQTPTKLYLVQDFMNGGELFFHMQNEGTFSEPRARFYTAELALALEHLHSCHVVYRDLKPENVLLSSQGHIVLVDFGLCKQNVTEDERTHTFCGTTEYLAPEIIRGTGYGKAVDWWSLGVLLYEMLVGASPFADSRTEGTHHKILHQPVIFPTVRPGMPIIQKTQAELEPPGFDRSLQTSSAGISRNAQDLIQKLLDKNPKTRLGSGPNNAEAVAAIKAHPFFQGIDWVRLQTRDVTPPFQPHVGVMGDLDVSNFDTHFTDQNSSIGMKSPRTKGSGILSPSSSSSQHLSLGSDGPSGSFMLQQQQRAANQYRQQQKRADNSSLNPVATMRGRRSSNSWSSYRTLSNDSLFSLSESSSPMQMRGATQAGAPLHRTMTAHRARALQQQQQQPSGQPQHQQQRHLYPSSLQQRQQEYFKGFTFEGESVLESMKRQQSLDPNILDHLDGGDDTIDVSCLGHQPKTTGNEQDTQQARRVVVGFPSRDHDHDHPAHTMGLSQRRPNELFSGEPESVDSIFGSM